MAIEIKFTSSVERLEELNKQLPEIINRVITKYTSWLQEDITRYTPVDTGALKWSIGQQVVGPVGIVFTDIQYAPFVEYGTRKPRRKGSKMFRVAAMKLDIDEFKSDIVNQIKEAMDEH